MTGTWSLGVLVGLPAVDIVLLAVAIGAVAAWRYEDAEFIAVILGVTIVLVALGTVAAMWPLKAEYHRWEPKTGTVTEINRRLISDGDRSMNERIVVRYGDGQEYGCDDTRCSLLKRGDALTLMCKREYQWTGTPDWSCNFGRVIRRG